jgi:hypothetical protein
MARVKVDQPAQLELFGIDAMLGQEGSDTWTIAGAGQAQPHAGPAWEFIGLGEKRPRIKIGDH